MIFLYLYDFDDISRLILFQLGMCLPKLFFGRDSWPTGAALV